MKKYLKIQIEVASEEEAEILTAQLSEINYYAFEEENNFFNAYVNEEDFDEEKLKEILPPETGFVKEIIEEENWNQKWESQLQPVIINDFVAVRPSFSAPITNVKYELIITPKMSFGTGHHATTHLMIQLMETINFKNQTVVDFGTGTGVLAVLAEKCGAKKVVAIDYDEWSVENAMENIEANECHRIELKQQSSLEGIGKADIVLANINLNVLRNEVHSLSQITKTGSVLLVSGFLVSDQLEMETVFMESQFVKLKSCQLDNWMAIMFEKKF
jgi:ribosomal protein L11 methyltransferase